ncbi:MAG: ATP-binding protein [Marinilabilia sp.]
MLIEPYIEKSYPRTEPLKGINTIETELMDHRFFVVMEEPEKYLGMLTIPDVLSRKKKLVADCLTPKPHITPNSSVEEAMMLMTSTHLPALPVIDNNNKFHGILSQNKLIETLKAHQKERNELYEKEISLSERIKEEFIRSISHEIRTPLNAIQGLSEILIYSDISEEDKENFAGLLHAKTDELLNVVESLLDLARLQAGDFDFDPVEDVNPEEMCRDLTKKASAMRTSYQKEHIILKHTINLPESYRFKTRQTYLQQVMIHLINNALKFTEKGHVEFGCYQNKEEDLIFYVNDTGIGIEAEKQKRIFQAFEKVWEANQHIYPGMGLGLTIASRIIEAAGGRIWFKSTPGKGTCFYFSLPEKINTISQI